MDALKVVPSPNITTHIHVTYLLYSRKLCTCALILRDRQKVKVKAQWSDKLNLVDGSELHISVTTPEIGWSYKTKVHRLITPGFLGHRVLSNAPRNHVLLNGVPLLAMTQCPGKQQLCLYETWNPHKSETEVNLSSSPFLCVLFSVDLSQGFMKSRMGFNMRLPACLSLLGVGLKVCTIMPCLRSKSRNTIINRWNHNNLT